jgi:hypothetical protein
MLLSRNSREIDEQRRSFITLYYVCMRMREREREREKKAT